MQQSIVFILPLFINAGAFLGCGQHHKPVIASLFIYQVGTKTSLSSMHKIILNSGVDKASVDNKNLAHPEITHHSVSLKNIIS